MNRSRTVFTALVVLSVLALGACSGDDPQPKVADPSPSSSLPTAPSTTAVSGPVEPTMPAAAQGTDAAAAEAFVDYWFTAWSYAMNTGDTSAIREASASSCVSCQSLFDRVERVYDKGGRVETDGWAVGASRIVGNADQGSTVFLLRVEESRQLLLDANKVIDRTPATKVPMQITLRPSAGGWMVTALEILG